MIPPGRPQLQAWRTGLFTVGIGHRAPDLRWALPLAVPVLCLACDSATTLVIRAEDERGEPIPELEIAAMPVDPVRLLDSLRDAAPRPAPDFSELEAELRTWTRPDDDPYEELNRPWLALRDSVLALSDSLHAMDRTEPGYATRYARFRQLYARLAERAAQRDRALRDISGSEVTLARRAAEAADSLRAWEYEAFAAYGELVAAAVVRSGREVAEGTTDAVGVARLPIEPGRWWLVARHPDPDNPFMEQFWSVPVTVTRLMPVRVPLTPENAEWRWRH